MFFIYLIQTWIIFTTGYCNPFEWAALTKNLEPSSQIHWIPYHQTFKTLVDHIQERRYKRHSTSVKEVSKPNEEANGNKTCCMGTACYAPCPFPVMPVYPLPPPQVPIVVPARTVYEPVIHNHPSPRRIAEIIRADKKRNRFSSSSSDETYSDTDSSESDTYTDYYSYSD